MVTRLHNVMLAMLLMLATLFAGFGALAQNPASGGYQHFEQGALATFDDNHLNALAKFAALSEIAPECCNAPNTGRFSGITARDADEVQFLRNAEATFGDSSTWTSITRHRGELVVQRSDIELSPQNITRMRNGQAPFVRNAALLHKWPGGQTSPFPGRIYPTASVTGMPRAV